MKCSKNAVYHLFLTRVMAMTLSLFMLVQLLIPDIKADSFMPNTGSPVIYSGGMPVYDGMEINHDDLLYPRYLFKSTRKELAGLNATIPLPEHLRAADAMSADISGTDSNGDELDVGILTIDEDGNVNVSFFSSLDGTGLENANSDEPATDGVTEDENPGIDGAAEDENPETDGVAEDENPEIDGVDKDGNSATDGITEVEGTASGDGAGALDDSVVSGAPRVNMSNEPSDTNEPNEPSGTGEPDETDDTGEQTEVVEESESGSNDTLSYMFMPSVGTPAIKQIFAEAIDPDEEITVDFVVPAMLDVSGLTANKDGSYPVTLLSGGREVTVTLVAPAVAAQMRLFALPVAAVATPAATSGSTSFEEVVSIKEVKLLDANSNDLGSHATVGVTNTFRLSYEFEMDKSQTEALKEEITRGHTTYKVPISGNLTLSNPLTPSNISTPLMVIITDPTTNKRITLQYGVLDFSLDENGVMTAAVIFGGEFWNDSTAYYSKELGFKGGFEFSCRLDNTKVNGLDPVDIELTESNTVTLDFLISSNPDSITKTGKYDNNTNEIAWTVAYTTGTSPRNLPIIFTDTFDDTYQQFVTNSFNIKCEYPGSVNNSDTPIPDTNSYLDFATNGNTLKYTIDSASTTPTFTNPIPPNTKITFTYKTVVAPAYYASATAGVTSLKNHAEISPKTGEGPTVKVDANPSPAPDKQWVTKSGTADSIMDGIINWTVVVDTQNFSIENLMLYDLIADKLQVVGDVTVKGTVVATSGTPPVLGYLDSADNINFPSDSTSLPASLNNTPKGPTILAINLKTFNNNSDSYSRLYTIRYATKVDDTYYLDNFNPTFTNTAWIDFNWPAGTNAGDVPQQYTTGKSTDTGPGNTQLITKSGVYDEVNRKITWTIIVNPHHVNVTEGTVTDTLISTLTYKQNTFTVNGAPVFDNGSDLTWTATDGVTTGFEKFTYQVGNIGTSAVTITFETEVDTSKYDQTNTNIIYHPVSNDVYFNGIVDFEGEPTSVKDQYTANVSIPLRWVSKAVSGTYNYADKTAEWLITVNGGAAKIKNVKLVDELPLYMEIANTGSPSSSVVVSDSKTGASTYNQGTGDTEYTVVWNSTLNTLTVDLHKIPNNGTNPKGKTIYVRITTRVKVDALPALMSGSGSANIANPNATVTFDYDGGGSDSATSGGATQTITNKMLSKTHTTGYDDINNTISYEVNVNPVQLTLSNCKLVDDIPRELRLDVTSVKLYDAAVTSTGGVTKGNEISATAFTWVYDVTSNQLTVMLPNAGKAYVLNYRCQVINYKSSIKNTITLKGQSNTSISSGSDTLALNAKAWATGIDRSAATGLKIFKFEEGTTTPIPGITFKLYTGSGSTKRYVNTQTTNSSGILIFSGLNTTETYYLEEVPNLSSGYDNTTAKVGSLSLAAYSFTPIAAQTDTITITNKLIPPPPQPQPTPAPTPYTPPERTRNRRNRTPVTPVTPITPTTPVVTTTTSEESLPPPPPPSQPGNTIVPSETEKNVYIEIGPDGVPVGRWRQVPDETGELIWIFEEDTPLGRFPDTGDTQSDMLFLWVLCFCISSAVMTAVIWFNRKKKT